MTVSPDVAWRLSPGEEGGSVPSPAPLRLQQDKNVDLVLSRAHSLCPVGVWVGGAPGEQVTAFGGATVPLER